MLGGQVMKNFLVKPFLTLSFLGILALGLASGMAAARADEVTRVYLFRGVLNIFSLGLDEIADKLEARNVQVTVLNHSSTSSARMEILAGGTARRPGTRPLVLVGHSLGANAVMRLANSLNEENIKVNLVITLDPTNGGPLSPNVRRYINYHFSDEKLSGFPGTPAAVRRRVRDINLREYETVSGEALGHFNMDSSEKLQQEIITGILRALR